MDQADLNCIKMREMFADVDANKDNFVDEWEFMSAGFCP